jgi:hypothetical protein
MTFGHEPWDHGIWTKLAAQNTLPNGPMIDDASFPGMEVWRLPG